jgi:hypothetical protein
VGESGDQSAVSSRGRLVSEFVLPAAWPTVLPRSFVVAVKSLVRAYFR